MVSPSRLAASKRSLAGAIGAGILVLGRAVEAIASNRSKLASSTGSGGAFGTTTVPYIYYRSPHRSNKKLRAPKGTFWNGAVDTGAGNAPWEHGPSDGAVATVYGAIWTGTVDPTLADQTGVTIWPLTFLGIQTGARRVKDLQYVTRTWADFVAAGGAVSGDGRTVTIPSGWSVEHDRVTGLTLEKGQRYLYAIEHGVPGASSSTPKQAVRGVITQGAVDKGDRSKNATAQVVTTAGKNPCDDPNWTNGNNMPGVAAASICYAPIIVTGQDDTGTVKTVAVDGDSINDENNDTLRDADGIAHGISRALNREGYSFFKTAIFSSSMGNQRTYGGNAYRLGLLEYADAVITNHGHNDSGLLTTDASMKSIFRWHGLALRAAMRGGKRLVRMTLTPTGKYATARSGGSTTSVQLASSESATNDIYVGSQIKMVTGPAAGQYGTITAYDGSTKIATVSPTNTWSVAATSGNYGINYPAQDPATDGSLVIANPFIMRTDAYAGIAFDPSVGDPDAGLDAFASYAAANGRWADILDTFDMTHPASPGAEKSAAYFTAARLTAALGFAA